MLKCSPSSSKVLLLFLLGFSQARDKVNSQVYGITGHFTPAIKPANLT